MTTYEGRHTHKIRAKSDDVELQLCLREMVGSDIATIVSQKILEINILERFTWPACYLRPSRYFLAYCQDQKCDAKLNVYYIWSICI